MSFKAFLLVLLILVCGLFIYLKSQVLGDPNSYFNQHTRFTLGKHPITRWILGLHNDGDARAEYLQGSGPIVIEVVESENVGVGSDNLKAFADQVTRYTGRPVQIINEEKVGYQLHTEKDLAEIANQHRRHILFGDTNLFIMYLNDFDHEGSQVGRTYNEYGIVVSDKELTDLTKDYPSSKSDYIKSTLLHEFGHQIGLDHNDDPNCIMATVVDSPDKITHFFSDITPKEFCNLELDQLNQIKANLY